MRKTKEELAAEYSARLHNAIYAQPVADDIIKEINSLTYSDSGQPLTLADKEEIAQRMKPRIELREADNRQYLTLVSYILSQLKK